MSFISEKNNECIISDADIRRDVSGDGRQVWGELSLYKHALSWCELGPVSLLVTKWERKEVEKIGRYREKNERFIYFIRNTRIYKFYQISL